MYCFILFYLAVLATDVESFGGHCSKRIVRRSMKSTSLAAAKESMALSRFSAILVGSTLPFLLNFDAAEIKQNHISFVSVPERASADSTGKMSTKLTARKRYLPRVKAGVSEFKKLSQSLDAASLATFETDSVSFVRAMDLYGVSLRKGETPDEISRKAKQLTDTFATEVKKLEKVKGDGILPQYKLCITALDNYLEYAKLPISSDESY